MAKDNFMLCIEYLMTIILQNKNCSCQANNISILSGKIILLRKISCNLTLIFNKKIGIKLLLMLQTVSINFNYLWKSGRNKARDR